MRFIHTALYILYDGAKRLRNFPPRGHYTVFYLTTRNFQPYDPYTHTKRFSVRISSIRKYNNLYCFNFD